MFLIGLIAGLAIIFVSMIVGLLNMKNMMTGISHFDMDMDMDKGFGRHYYALIGVVVGVATALISASLMLAEHFNMIG